MLSNPQHLNIFLSHFAADPEPQIFNDYQSMLEAAFKRRVLESGTNLTAIACEQISLKMSDAEELWIGRSAFDQQYPKEVDRLMAAAILHEDGRRIGFRHQTIFDYVQTRAFAAGDENLATYVLQRQDAVFVRSVTLAALHALKASSVEIYHRVMGRLWNELTVRKHLRLLFISLLWQVTAPIRRRCDG